MKRLQVQVLFRATSTVAIAHVPGVAAPILASVDGANRSVEALEALLTLLGVVVTAVANRLAQEQP